MAEALQAERQVQAPSRSIATRPRCAQLKRPIRAPHTLEGRIAKNPQTAKQFHTVLDRL